jgi:hypothetical protein
MKLQLAPNTSRPLKSLICQTAFDEMIEKGYFNFSTVESASAIIGKNLTREVSRELRILHCVDFDKMPLAVIEFISKVLEGILED